MQSVHFPLKSQIIPSLGGDVRAADSSAATANRQTEEGGKKNVSAEPRLKVAFCFSQRHMGNGTRVNKMIRADGQTRCFCSLNSNPAFNPTRKKEDVMSRRYEGKLLKLHADIGSLK